jgi:hypothetical protein
MASAHSPPADQAGMSARDALHALGDLPRYEEALTARAYGMTSMVWGFATAGIVLSYGLAQLPFSRHGIELLFTILWLPWVAMGAALTAAIWHSQALSLRRDPGSKRGVLTMLAYIGGFFLLAAASLVVIEVVLDAHFNFYLEMLFVNGLFAAVVGLAERGRSGSAWGTFACGLLAAGLALALIPLRLQSDEAALIAAAAAGAAFFLPGLYGYVKG